MTATRGIVEVEGREETLAPRDRLGAAEYEEIRETTERAFEGVAEYLETLEPPGRRVAAYVVYGEMRETQGFAEYVDPKEVRGLRDLQGVVREDYVEMRATQGFEEYVDYKETPALQAHRGVAREDYVETQEIQGFVEREDYKETWALQV